MDRSSLKPWYADALRIAPPAAAVLGSLALLLSPAPAPADGPGAGSPWAVSVGDSYISGEAGRWAGNTDTLGYSATDALGPKAYYDNSTETAELIPGCHRSKSAEIHFGGVSGENLACSGARTASFTASNHDFKPGLDFYDTAGDEGQALMLERFAATHDVKLVAVSIGGNNYNFASIVEQCIKDYLTSTESHPLYCKNDPSVLANFTPANVAVQTAAIQGAIVNVAKAMRGAGYSTSQYTLVVQDYPSPIPDGDGFRYAQAKDERQLVGGCGFWSEDADWANSFALPTIDDSIFEAATKTGLPNIEFLQLFSAFDGRRLCEKRENFGLLEEVKLTSWRAPGAVDKTEWINQARIINFPPYQLQEDLHPNYWGQLALSGCLTLVYNAGSPRSGGCTIAGEGLNSEGEPRMTLGPAQRLSVTRRRRAVRHHRGHPRPHRRRGRSHELPLL